MLCQLAFAHFCELHGPSIISTLQAYPAEENNAPPVFSPVATFTVPGGGPTPGPTTPYPPASTSSTTTHIPCAACSMHLPQSIASTLSRPQAPTLRTSDPMTGYTYITTRYPKSQTRYSALRTSVVRALSSELVPSRTGPILFGDAHNGYTIAYVFAIDDPGARGGKREGRRWYAFLALFEGETDATASWLWITKGFEQMASGLKEQSSRTRRESEVRMDGAEFEQAISRTQSISLEERPANAPQIRLMRGSFGHPEGFIRRPRFGNPVGTTPPTAATVKSLAELIGLEGVDVEIHAAMGWIMSGLLGPTKEVSVENSKSLNTQAVDGRSTVGLDI
jgi:Vesicle coat protein involved in Golgi to plasma membrane transport